MDSGGLGAQVEVPLAGLPVSGQGLQVSIAGLQLNSMEALEPFGRWMGVTLISRAGRFCVA